MIDERIKHLREEKSLTQAGLAKRLGVTRSCVNAWEMGISVPSTQYLVELANIFQVSTDYLLGIHETVSVNVTGLTERDIQIIHTLVSHLKDKNEHKK